MSKSPTFDELEQIWRSKGIAVETLQPESDGTIPPPGPETPDEQRQVDALTSLPQVLGPDYRMERMLARGGAGAVHLATQVPLGRQVAVKTVDRSSDRDTAALAVLREARVTGLLEHPNIVPVYTLAQNEHGDPLFVMKRVEGVSLQEFIADPDHPARANEHRDILEFHLDVLMQVCNAVHFAHNKGIVHRDLKPDNVMVGQFGEVYVLDWGMAVTTRDELGGLLRHARDVAEVAGTPRYMAPEMAAADGTRIDERTDVYLLGAILCECLTGEAPHQAPTIADTMLAAYRSEPRRFAPSVPPELAEICNRAMHRDPGQRFASADELRLAVADFLRHRSSLLLAQEATATLELLRQLIVASRTTEVDPAEVNGMFRDCRLGFQHALLTWAENPQARQGLAAALELMANHHLDQDDHRAASLLVAEMESPPPRLAERCQEVAERQRHREQQLQTLEQEMDLEVGKRTRSRIVAAFAVTYFTLPLLASLADRRGWLKADLFVVAAIALSFVLLAAIGVWWGRRMLLKTEVNRRIVRALLVLSVAMIILPFACLLLNLDGRGLQTLLLLIYGMLFGHLGATVDRRLFFGWVVYFVAFMLAAWFPAAVFELTSVSTLVATAHAAYVWRPESLARRRGQ